MKPGLELEVGPQKILIQAGPRIEAAGPRLKAGSRPTPDSDLIVLIEAEGLLVKDLR